MSLGKVKGKRGRPKGSKNPKKSIDRGSPKLYWQTYVGIQSPESFIKNSQSEYREEAVEEYLGKFREMFDWEPEPILRSKIKSNLIEHLENMGCGLRVISTRMELALSVNFGIWQSTSAIMKALQERGFFERETSYKQRNAITKQTLMSLVKRGFMETKLVEGKVYFNKYRGVRYYRLTEEGLNYESNTYQIC